MCILSCRTVYAYQRGDDVVSADDATLCGVACIVAADCVSVSCVCYVSYSAECSEESYCPTGSVHQYPMEEIYGMCLCMCIGKCMCGDGMGWDGMEWNGMGCDAMGYMSGVIDVMCDATHVCSCAISMHVYVRESRIGLSRV